VYHQPQLVAAAKDNEGACPSGHESDSEGRCRAVDGAEGVVSLDPYALEEYVLKHQVSVCVCVRACVCSFVVPAAESGQKDSQPQISYLSWDKPFSQKRGTQVS
jgi:hypothetical protein